VQEWQQQFDKLESVDLRYDRQIIVNPDSQGAAKQPPISAGAAKKAMAAGVKPAALITRMTAGPKPSPVLAVKTVPPLVLKPSPARPVAGKQVAAKKMVKAGHRKTHVRQTRLKTKTKPKATASAVPKSGPKASAVGSAGNTNPQAVAKVPAKPSPAIAKGEETQ
jgi:hypothetical protein